MLKSCEQNNNFVNFTTNITLHVLFLFTILSILFIKIISKLETDAINNELTNVISDSIENGYDKLNLNEKILIGDSIRYVDFKNLIELYDREDTTRRLNNKGIYRAIYITITMLIIIIVILLLVSKKLCNNVPIEFILKQNIIIFIGVGIIEYLFFKNIILEYVPVKPSFMMEYMVKKIQSTL